MPQWTQADHLRKAREHAELEQADLATAIGVSRNTVINYERGKVQPRKHVVMAWALATGVPVVWLETGNAPGGGQPGPDGGGWAPRDSNPEPTD